MIASRLLQALVVVAIVTTLVFILIHVAPGDPFGAALDNPNVTEALRARWRVMYGLDRPLGEQYLLYLRNVARGDFGWSFSMHRPVLDVLAAALPNTLLLAGTAMVLGFGGGIALAILQARRPGSRTDRFLGAGAMFFYAMPDFWLALMMMLIFAYWFPLFPVAGAVDPVMHDYMGPIAALGDRIMHLALPAITLALLSGAAIARYQRAELLRMLPEDFVTTARAKGVSERRVLCVHILRNALIPTVSLLGLSLPVLFTGAVFVERVFAWPGMGWVVLNGVATRDYPLVMAGVVIAAVTVTLGSLLADLLYAVVDPRIRER
ncbi:MAG: ABC transporter permease [Gemmatimonadota bacterium]|nr:ABC transporter permease [Gemmatimonadota bacterium]